MPTKEELLYKEKLSLLLHNIRNRDRKFCTDGCRIPKKDAEVSTSLRKQGNVLYMKMQNKLNNNLNTAFAGVHVEVWNKYTESILYAPNYSEELALGYGNRSALLFYLRQFEECTVECDRALSITSNDCLRFKLLCRKAESLCNLNRCAKEVCQEALKLLDSLDLEETQKKYYEAKLHVLIVANTVTSVFCETHEKKNYVDALKNFKRSEEIPCASKSVALQYNEKWGRHIVAIEDIPVGKIIGVGDYFFTTYNDNNCNNCTKKIRLNNSFPCEHCVYNLYCSESCYKEVWEKYHQFQCCIIPFLNFTEIIKGTSEKALKFILLSVHQAGGIEQMKQQLLEIQNVHDPRVKGFSDGVFHDEKLLHFFCLEQCREENLNDKIRFAFLENSCLCAYLLAKYTNFFGKKINLLEAEMFLNEDILFIASLFLRFYYSSHRNMNELTNKDNHFEVFSPFGSLFNHSCDPNVYSLHDYRVHYIAEYPIKKGSQLFLAYDNQIFYNVDKESRQKYLQKKYEFTCNCLACTENWSSVCLPSLKHVLEIAPSLETSLPVDIIKLLKSFHKYANSSITEFKPKLAKMVVYHLNLLSVHFTVHCEEYLKLFAYLLVQYIIALNNSNPYKQGTISICKSIFKK